MLIIPQLCAGKNRDYSYNDAAERAVAAVLSKLTNLPVTDFSEGIRPSHDYLLDWLPVEQKLTMSERLPVELWRDVEHTTPSGLATSHAPVVLYLSKGYYPETNTFVGKLRMYERKPLINAAFREGTPFSFGGETFSQGSAGYNVNPRALNDIWLADIAIVETEDGLAYDTDQITRVGMPVGVYDLMETIKDRMERGAQK